MSKLLNITTTLHQQHEGLILLLEFEHELYQLKYLLVYHKSIKENVERIESIILLFF